MTAIRTEAVPCSGGSMTAHLVVPAAGSGPGILLIQEIFGVNDYIRAVADRLAAAGYVVLAPDMFWRIEPHVEENGTGPEELEQAVAMAGRFDPATGLDDMAAALAHLRSLPETAGPVAVVGFCFGGTMAFMAAARLDPDAAVSYYGSGVAGSLDMLGGIDCPVLFHFGAEDGYLPASDVELIRSATAGRAGLEIVVQPDAGHAFDNHLNPNFSQPRAAAAAWERTSVFLARHLGVA